MGRALRGQSLKCIFPQKQNKKYEHRLFFFDIASGSVQSFLWRNSAHNSVSQRSIFSPSGIGNQPVSRYWLAKHYWNNFKPFFRKDHGCFSWSFYNFLRKQKTWLLPPTFLFLTLATWFQQCSLHCVQFVQKTVLHFSLFFYPKTHPRCMRPIYEAFLRQVAHPKLVKLVFVETSRMSPSARSGTPRLPVSSFLSL